MGTLTLEVLHVADCANLTAFMANLSEATDLPVTTRLIDADTEVAGSPTLLVNGVDPFAVPGQYSYGEACRLYRDENGAIVRAPSVSQFRHAIAEAGSPPGVLSAWRTSAVPLDPTQRAVHQTVLRTWAKTG